jgi:hypothetical protein
LVVLAWASLRLDDGGAVHRSLLGFNAICARCSKASYFSAFHGARTYFLAMIPGTGKNNTCNVGRDDPFGTSRPQRDVRLQIYISLTLGMGAFVSFCASLPTAMYDATALISPAVTPPTLERPVCCAQEAEQSCHGSPRTPRQLIRLDHTAMENHRRGGAGFGRPGCLRIPRVFQNGYKVPPRDALLRPSRHQAGPRHTQGEQEITSAQR